MRDPLDGVTWFRGSSIRIRRDGLEIHVDPHRVTEDSAADLVMLTHPHYDNFSEADIARVRDAHTILVAPASMKKQIGDADHLMRPGDMLQLEGLDILAVPAYNVDKKFHTPEHGWLAIALTSGDHHLELPFCYTPLGLFNEKTHWRTRTAGLLPRSIQDSSGA